MVVVSGYKESQSWSEQRKYRESNPWNRSFTTSFVSGVTTQSPSFHYEVYILEQLRFQIDEREPVAFQRAENCHSAWFEKRKWGLEQGLPTKIPDSGSKGDI